MAPPLRIAVIDDHADTRDSTGTLIQLFFRPIGHEVEVCCHPAEEFDSILDEFLGIVIFEPFGATDDRVTRRDAALKRLESRLASIRLLGAVPIIMTAQPRLVALPGVTVLVKPASWDEITGALEAAIATRTIPLPV